MIKKLLAVQMHLPYSFKKLNDHKNQLHDGKKIFLWRQKIKWVRKEIKR